MVLTVGTAQTAHAQTCPVAAACTPGNASSGQASSFGMGILNVTVGNNLINNTSANYTEGYKDNSCAQNAALTVAQPYAISVRTGPNAPENVRVWVDYNNDGAFTGANELVFSSDNATLHTGTFTPPATAVLSTRLRLRVAADYANGTIPTSCSRPQYSQDEDYSVTLSANASPPVAAFTVSATTTCTGCVQFTDASQNVPTSWLWTFGDGQTSTAQNPNHCYTTAGSYAVTLKATNAAGNTTSAATTITYNTTVPLAASCTPQTQSYFANYGITRFRLNTIDNTSADGSAGYQDFTCTQRTELTVGVNYSMIITTGGTNPHDIRVYLDQNNDGTLTTTEQLYTSAITASPGATATLNLPTGIVLNQPLRLRVVADAIGNTTGPCVNPVSGQAEDYTVIVRPNTLPPVINFSSNYVAGSCVNPVQFTDLSTNAPTSWQWDFGDGSANSTVQNPSHQYAATGTYNVTLTATNAFGTASITRLNAVSVQVPCVTYCSANGTGPTAPGGQTQASPFWITNVNVPSASYANASGNSTTGYTSYVATPITVAPGSTVPFTVITNVNVIHRTAVWVDLNQNGSFNDTGELVATGISANGAAGNSFTGSFTVPARTFSTRMRVLVQANANTNVPGPCSVNLLNAEVEDYLLRVQPLATRSELALPSLTLYPTPTLDGRLRLALADGLAAGLYTTEVRNLLGAVVLRAALRLSPAEAELDLSALPAGVYVLQLRDAQGQTATRRVVRQ
ncbi:GEVED domain-containing protein [Hymenobacter sp. DH14]|uniref:GEVED domain-containing protein n=1 Tax=Hymenobacter cyanobacteriorum TaxID=2926463 RepID=A0A9X2AGC8_9BACT|nr:GEVED domain-containing protein [Hymenobacter cyanobacteriorum]MCI1186160.1 GEVED domain-containing protein [Hymenobacter cyanobacteriorum]